MAQWSDEFLPLGRAYHWENVRTREIYLVQPMSDDSVRSWTWQQTMDEARRIATFLRARGWEPGSRIATLARNSAWWIIAELGAWMAGLVTVPLYPSLRADSIRTLLQHADVRACFVGAMDDREAMQQGIPVGVCESRCPMPRRTCCVAATGDGTRYSRNAHRSPTRQRVWGRARHHHLYLGHYGRAQGRDASVFRVSAYGRQHRKAGQYGQQRAIHFVSSTSTYCGARRHRGH